MEVDNWADLVKKIAVPRKTGTVGERDTREFIRDEWNSLINKDGKNRLKVSEQVFTFPHSAPDVLRGVFIFVFVMVLFLNSHFVLGENTIPFQFITWIFPLLILLALSAGTRWNSFIERFYRYKEKNMIETSNIIASLDSKAEKTIVFTAHLDSKAQNIDILTRIFLAGFCAVSSGIIALYSFYYLYLVKRIYETLTILSQMKILQLNLALMILTWGVILILITLFFSGSDNESEGALDNASGVVVLMELVRYFNDNPPKNVNLEFIATAAEEDGLIGMVKNLDEGHNKYQKGKVCFVNMDCVGGTGEIKIIDSYGIPPVRTSGKLSDKLKESAKRMNIRAKSVYSPAGAGYDSIPAAYRGYESVTLACCKLFGELALIHSENDRIEKIDYSSLEKTFSLCKELVENYE